MKILRHAGSIVAAFAFAGAATFPVLAFETPGNQVQSITAEFVPTQEQVQSELTDLHARLQAAARASFYSAKASREYLAAQRYFELGFYDQASAHVRIAGRALPANPNWVSPATALR
jgi:transposase